ncbi:hypothetical protein [Citrobacter arsenatis]|uniref:hypothetical protein n=1 Tax=Citrobacter arsenatis TaxID=2546350 RepID=UPI00300E29EF
MPESEFDIILPESERLPVKPRYRLWFCLSLLIAVLTIGFLFFIFPLWWREDPVFLSVIGISLACFLFAIRINVFERKLNFSSIWNSTREQYISELLGVRQKSLPISRLIVLTSNGENGNSQLAWQNIPQLRFANNKKTKQTEINLPGDKITNAEKRICGILDLLLRAIASDINLHQISECVISYDGLLQAHAIKMKCQEYGLEPSLITMIDNAESDGLLNDWMQDTKKRERLFIVLNALSDKDNSAEIASLFVFSDANNKSPKIHRAVEYTKKNSPDIALQYGSIEAKDIEAVWCSGVDDYLCSQVVMTLKVSNSITPRIINVDEIFGYSGSAAEWFLVGLASEWAATSHKPQLILTQNERTLIRVIYSS